MDFKILPNGNLKITRNRKDKQELREMLAKTNDDRLLMAELLEFTGWQPNGQLYLISPEDVGALTDSPIITDDMTIEDDGAITVHGEVYWYPNYMVSNFMEELLRDGKTIFTKAETVAPDTPKID